MPLLSVIIFTCNGKQFLRDCLVAPAAAAENKSSALFVCTEVTHAPCLKSSLLKNTKYGILYL